MDISLSISRIKGYKAFANKIWNASRYVLMNLQGDEAAAIDPRAHHRHRPWILHELNAMVEKVNGCFDEYRMYEAADLIYHFIWDEYCDWYLEFSKSDLESPDTRAVLSSPCCSILQLLHPFMPYISEEIYQMIKSDKEFLVQTAFPAFDSEPGLSRSPRRGRDPEEGGGRDAQDAHREPHRAQQEDPGLSQVRLPGGKRAPGKAPEVFRFPEPQPEDGDRRRLLARCPGASAA